METKKPSDSLTVSSGIIRPRDANSVGSMYGGEILDWMDMAASICARRHSRLKVNTVAVLDVSFCKKLKIGHIVRLEAVITRTFKTSMDVYVAVYDENTYTNEDVLCVKGHFILVGLDEEGKPTLVPKLVPITPEEKIRWEQAENRRMNKKDS